LLVPAGMVCALATSHCGGEPARPRAVVAASSRDAGSAEPDLQTRMATVVYRDEDYRRYACDADDCAFDEFRKHIAFRREILRARPEAAGYFVEPTDQRGNFFTGFFVVRSVDPELQTIFMGTGIGATRDGGERAGFKLVVGTERTSSSSWTHHVFGWNGSRYVEASTETFGSDWRRRQQ